MTLNKKENLINCEIYFHEILKYSVCFKEYAPRKENLFGDNVGKEVLVISVASVYHMLSSLSRKQIKDSRHKLFKPNLSIKKNEIQFNNIINKRVAIPKKYNNFYGTGKKVQHSPPCFMICETGNDKHNEITSSGKKIQYHTIIYAFAGLKNLTAFNYFLYCFDRECDKFKAIPQDIVENIEHYLKEKGRPIFDSL